MTVVAGLVFAVIEPFDWSVAVTVDEPAVLRITENVFVPATRAAGAGGVALASLVLSATVSVAETGFQFASTALTVTVKLAAAVCALGVPVLPDAVPGAAVSPGMSSWSLANAPALIVVAGLVFAVIVPLVMSVEVKVALPAVFAVTANVFVPATSALFAGSVALASLEVMPTTSVALTEFQFASTAFTVTLKLAPAVCADGVPVLPDAVPGAAVSPGRRIWSFAKAPPLTVVAGLVLAVIAPLVMSVAVNVGVDAVFGVIENVFVPATSAAFAGSVAFGSVEVMPTVSVEVTGFQLASTALTVTVNDEPAV